MHKTMKTELIYYSFLPNCWGKFSRGGFGDLLKWGGGGGLFRSCSYTN